MPEPPAGSNWQQATDALAPECPFCGNDRDLERRGPEWWCPVCSREWLARTRTDLRVLKVAGIDPT